MRPLTGTRLTLLLALIALAAPAPSFAQGGQEVIRDCAEDGDLDGDYSQDELDEAYDNMPSDIDQYSNCREVIDAARERANSGSDDGGGSGAGGAGGDSPGAAGGTPGGRGNDFEELENRRDRSHGDDAPSATVAGEAAENSGGTFSTDAESDGLPTPLIIALIVAALGALAGGLYLLRDQLPAAIGSRLPGPLKQDSRV